MPGPPRRIVLVESNIGDVRLFETANAVLQTRRSWNGPRPHQPLIAQMRDRLFQILEETGGMSMPIYPDRGGSSNRRSPNRSKAAEFPADLEKLPPRPPATARPKQ